MVFTPPRSLETEHEALHAELVPPTKLSNVPATVTTTPTEGAVRQALRLVIDPEIGNTRCEIGRHRAGVGAARKPDMKSDETRHQLGVG